MENNRITKHDLLERLGKSLNEVLRLEERGATTNNDVGGDGILC